MTDPETQPLEGDLDELSWLRRLARRLVADAHRADDAVQETWLAARGKSAVNRRGFLATLLRNRLRQEARGEGRRDRREEAVGRGRRLEEPSASETAQRLERSRLLLDALEGLEEPYQTAVTLRYLDDLPPRRIAARLGVPVKTVHTRLERGLAKMRARLDQRFGGDREAWLRALAPFGWTLGDALVATFTGAAMTTKIVLGTGAAACAAAVLLVAPGFLTEERVPQPEIVEADAPELVPARPTRPAQERASVSGARAAVEVEPAPAPAEATFAAPIPGTAILELYVFRNSGGPLADVTIEVRRADQGRLTQEPLARGRTGVGGWITLEVPARMPLQVLANADAPEVREGGLRVDAIAAGTKVAHDLGLDEGLHGRFHGEVVDDLTGALIVGALVVDKDPRPELVQEAPYESMVTNGFGQADILESDELGRFVVEYAPWDPREAWVAAPGYWPRRVDVGRQDQGPGRPHTVRLKRSAMVFVTVPGNEQTRIAFNAPGEPELLGHWQGPDVPIRVEVPAEADLRGEIWHRERGLLWQTPLPIVLEQAEERSLHWRPGGGVRVYGRVVDQDGAPVAEEEVMAWQAAATDVARFERALLGEGTEPPSALARTDGDGRFAFDSLPPGNWWIGIQPDEDPRRPMYAPLSVGVVLEEQELEREVLIETAHGWFINGVAQGPDGAPFTRGTISASPVDMFGRMRVNLATDGTFQIGPVVPGKYHLWLSGPGYMTSSRLTVSAGEALELQLGDHHALAGTIRDPDGRTFKAHVQAVSSSGSLGMGVSGQALGAFLFAELRPDVYAVKATTEDGRVAVVGNLDLRKGQTHDDLELLLRPGGKIRVELEGPPGFRCAIYQDGIRLEDSSIRGTVFAIAPEGEVRVEVYGKNSAGETVRPSQRVQSIPGRVQEVHFTID